MRIGLIYHQFISRGGLEKYLHSFADKLVSNGHDVCILTRTTDSVTNAFQGSIRRLPSPPLPSALDQIHFSHAAAAAALSSDYDITIGFGRSTTHDLHRAGGGCHRVYSRLLNPLKRAGLKNRVELALERELYTSGKTATFIVNSALVEEQIADEYGVDRDRIVVIHTPVDCEAFSPEPDTVARNALRERLAPGTRPEDRICLFVSRSHRRKGLDALLEAWRAPPAGARLWIVGATLKSTHRRFIARHRLEESVVAFADAEDVSPFYRSADFFVHPTLYDACANTVLQSMACGLPGLISVRDGAVQFVEHGVSGYHLETPDDPASLRTSLDRLLTADTSALASLGAAARQRVIPLTWDAHLARWMKTIDERIGR